MAPPSYIYKSSPTYFLFINLVTFLGFMTSLCSGDSSSQKVPALYVFGDSLVDVGNNNHLFFSLVKSTLPHNGIDFPTKKATGRFSEKVGLATSPPYLSVKDSNASSFLNGVSFASGGAGIFAAQGEFDFRGETQSIPLTKQVDYYTTVYQQLVELQGPTAALKHFSKSLFAVVIGSNDISTYFKLSDLQKKIKPQDYVHQMAHALKGQIKRLYEGGARKFVVAEVGVIGCCPAQRYNIETHECNEQLNVWARNYNEILKAILVELRRELKDFKFSLFNTYTFMHNLIHKPADYGLIEVKAACCGLGELNAMVNCLPISNYCSNRSDHLFWDLYHPTQATASLVVDAIFEGSSQYTFPVNVNRLLSL